MANQRQSSNIVQNLRQRTLHSSSLTRGEYNYSQLAQRASYLLPAPPLGFEPRPDASKGRRAAITPERTGVLPRDKSAREFLALEFLGGLKPAFLILGNGFLQLLLILAELQKLLIIGGIGLG